VTTRSLGPYPEVTLQMAKDRAYHNRLMLKRDKLNPWKVDSDVGPTKTFGEFARQWIANNNFRNAKQRRNAELLLMVHSTTLLDIPIIQIKPSRIHDALLPIWERSPHQVRRTLAMLTAVFDYVKSNNQYHAENPARWKEKQKHLFPRLPKVEAQHFEAMPFAMVPTFIHELRQHQNRSVAAVALEVLILTACRSEEIRGMCWSEVDLENRIWTIPAQRMKAGREHRVPLSDRVVELLKRQPVSATYVFVGITRDQPMDPSSMRSLLRTMGYKYSVHGFRSSFADWAGDTTDFNDVLIEECLAHTVGNKTRRAYRRGSAFAKRVMIMDAWAKFLG
jgi:integrase